MKAPARMALLVLMAVMLMASPALAAEKKKKGSLTPYVKKADTLNVGAFSEKEKAAYQGVVTKIAAETKREQHATINTALGTTGGPTHHVDLASKGYKEKRVVDAGPGAKAPLTLSKHRTLYAGDTEDAFSFDYESDDPEFDSEDSRELWDLDVYEGSEYDESIGY